MRNRSFLRAKNVPERLRNPYNTIQIQTQTSPKPEQHQATKSDEAPQNNPIPPLLCANFLHQAVDPRYLGRGPGDSPLNATQTLPLQVEALVHSVSLAEDRVGHVVAVVQVPALVQHVVRFCGFRVVAGPVGADV